MVGYDFGIVVGEGDQLVHCRDHAVDRPVHTGKPLTGIENVSPSDQDIGVAEIDIGTAVDCRRDGRVPQLYRPPAKL